MKSGLQLRGNPGAIKQQVLAARGGSASALGALLDAFRDYLMMIANAELDRGLRKKVGASDLVQETCLRAQKGFAGFEGTTEAELGGWLRQIMLNRCRNVRIAFKQTQKRNITCELSLTGTSSISGPADEVISEHLTPSAEAMAREEIMHVARIVARLPEDYKRVIRLRNWEDLGFDEIAVRMGRSREAIRKLWSRAIQCLSADSEAGERNGQSD